MLQRTSSRALKTFDLHEQPRNLQEILDIAEENLFSAVILYYQFSQSFIPLVTVCYLCLQATEKWLKIYLPLQGKFDKYGHDIIKMFDKASESNSDFAYPYSLLETISEHYFKLSNNKVNYTHIRYEDPHPDIIDHAITLFEVAIETRKIVLTYLRGSITKEVQ